MRIDGNRMTDRATEVVLSYYAAFNRGEWPAMLELVAEDVVHDINQGARETGKDALDAYLRHMGSCYKELLRDLVVMSTPAGDRAAAEYVVHGDYLKDDEGLPPARGQHYVLPGGAFFALRNGVIIRISSYYNLEDWVAQVTRAP